jgi:LmbE family N-acetylglucosaminyl deacetylase
MIILAAGLTMLLAGCSIFHTVSGATTTHPVVLHHLNRTIRPHSSISEQAAALTSNNASNTVIYFDPHPDDEVLTFGVPILNDLSAGKQVYLVLMSAGEHSIAREVVNGRYDRESFRPWLAGKRIYDKIHHRYHNPAAEGYQHFTVASFGEARIQEFIQASMALGVPSSHLAVYHLPNDHFTHAAVKRIMLDWIHRYPGATVKTMSAWDVHPDHAMLGRVLDELYKEGIVKNKENYASVATRLKFIHNRWPIIGLTHPQDQKILERAIAVYKTWDPKHGKFALGYISVPKQFDIVERHMISKRVSS